MTNVHNAIFNLDDFSWFFREFQMMDTSNVPNGESQYS